MNEPPALPPPELHEAPKPSPQRPVLPWLTGAGFLVLLAALLWVWRHPVMVPPDTAQMDALAHQASALQAQVAQLLQRPAPQVPDLGPLTARIAALERQQAAPPSPAAPDLSPLEARIAALEARSPGDQRLIARLDSLEADLGRRLDTDEARLAANAATAERITRVLGAELALDAGRPLGPLPGAPPALLRFATTNPPTEAALRLSFRRAMREALAASRPDTEGKPLLSRLWAEAQNLVTIRQGDRVLIGDPAAGALDRARTALDAGDLAAGVAAAATLRGPAAQAMSAWLAQARALLEARAALVAWAAHA